MAPINLQYVGEDKTHLPF